MLRRSHVLAIAILLLAAGIAGYTAFQVAKPPQATVTGKALVGGPFSLSSHTGERVSDKDFRGRYMLVTFGYTYCPDVCPALLQVMSAALDELGEEATRIQPIFITVDPERDTVAHLKDYMAHFHPRFLGLTGTTEEIAAVAKAYRVYYARAGDKDGADYLMDHTSIVYLMGPDGEFVKHFTYGTDAEALAAGLSAAIGS